MPGEVIQLDPVVIGDDREEERRELARAALARMMPAGSLDAIQVADPRPEAQRLPPLTPEPALPPALQRQAEDAQQVGDRYRASLRAPSPTPAPASPAAPNRLPMGPLSRPGESADVMAQATGAPVDRERLLAALRTRQGQPAGAPVPPSPEPAPRTMQLDPVPMNTPEDRARAAPPAAPLAPGMERIAGLRAPHPDAEVYGTATDSDPELPGRIRPGGADPNAEIYGEATDDDPVLPGRLGPGARPSQSLGDPSQTLPPDRERLAQLLRARQAPRSSPSASPAGAGSSRDFTGADWHDAIRRPLHGIGNALLAAAGRSGTPFRSERAQLEQRFARDDAASATAAQNEREADMAERRMSLQERSAATQEALGRERNEISREMQARRADISEERAESSRQQAEITGQLAQARLAGIQNETEREAAALDPASEPSQIARLSLSAALAGYPPAARARLAQQMGVSEDRLDEALSGLNMRQAEQLRASLPSMFRDTTNRRGGSTGTGGGGASSATRATLATPPEGWQGTPEQWAALRPQDQRRIIGQLGSRAPGEERPEGTEILPGVVSPLRMPASAAESLRSGIEDAAASAANIRGLATIHERHGGLGARISRQAQAEIVPRLTMARAMVAQMGNTGVINPGEVPTINAALPDPGDLSGWTFGTFNARMQAWQSILEERVRAKLASRGVDDAGIERVLSTIRTGSWSQGGGRGQPARAAGAAPAGDTVRVRINGRDLPRPVPRDRLEALRERASERGDEVEIVE